LVSFAPVLRQIDVVHTPVVTIKTPAKKAAIPDAVKAKPKMVYVERFDDKKTKKKWIPKPDPDGFIYVGDNRKPQGSCKFESLIEAMKKPALKGTNRFASLDLQDQFFENSLKEAIAIAFPLPPLPPKPKPVRVITQAEFNAMNDTEAAELNVMELSLNKLDITTRRNNSYVSSIKDKKIFANGLNLGASYFEILVSITEALSPPSCGCAIKQNLVDISNCSVHHTSGGCPKIISGHFRNFEMGSTINKFLSTMGGSVIVKNGAIGHITSYDPSGAVGVKKVNPLLVYGAEFFEVTAGTWKRQYADLLG